MVDLNKILDEVINSKRAIIVSLPMTVEWNDYEKELNAVKDYSQVINFKVPHFPKGVTKGCKCYILHKGQVMGWQEIVGFSEEPFECSTTGKSWSGKFIQRSGPFHPISYPIKMKGFQGFRYFDESLVKENNKN
jgi:hypothetical protein